MRCNVTQKSPRSAFGGVRLPMGGLSQALTAADPTSKKRPLTKQASLPCLDSPEAEQSPHHKPQRLRSALHHQLSELQGHQQPLQSNNDNGMPPVPEPSCQPAAPQPTCRIPAGAPIPEESGQIPLPSGPLYTFDIGGCDVSDRAESEADSSMCEAATSLSISQQQQKCSPLPTFAVTPSLPGSSADAPTGYIWDAHDEDSSSDGTSAFGAHTMPAAIPQPVTMQRTPLTASVNENEDDVYSPSFRPGSMMEGAGRKLCGTEAMRVRNNVLRRTGFLELHSNNMFTDHSGL